MSDLHALIRQHECEDPTDTATAVMDAIKLSKRHRALFFALLRDECRRLSRAAARIAERGDFEESGSSQHSTGTQTTGARSTFLDGRFFNGDDYVTWGDATVDDHLGRITFQQSLISGINFDIIRHRRAVKLIEKHGVETLSDIEGFTPDDLRDEAA